MCTFKKIDKKKLKKMDLIFELQKATKEKDNELEKVKLMLCELKNSYDYNIKVNELRDQQIEKLKNELNQIHKNKNEIQNQIRDINDEKQKMEQKYEERQNEIKVLFREYERADFNKKSLEYHIQQMDEVSHKLKMEQIQKATQENNEKKKVLKKQIEDIERDIDDIEGRTKEMRKDGNEQMTMQQCKHAEEVAAMRFKIKQIGVENESLSQRIMRISFNLEKKKQENKEKVNLAKKVKDEEDARKMKEYSEIIGKLRSIFEEKYMKVKALQAVNDDNINRAKCETDELAAIRNKQEQMEKEDIETYQVLKRKIKLFQDALIDGVGTLHEAKKTGNILQQQVLTICYRELVGRRDWEICKNEYESYKTKKENDIMFTEYQTKVRREELQKSEQELSSIWNIENELQPKLNKQKREIEKSAKKMEIATNELNKVKKAYFDQKESNTKLEAQLGYSIKKNAPLSPPKISSISISPPIIIKPGSNQANIDTLKQKLEIQQEKIKIKKDKLSDLKYQLSILSKYNGDIKQAIIKLALMTKKRKKEKNQNQKRKTLK